jgi:hypothetical protein
MAEDRGKDAPSLEPPSLFGRRKKRSSGAPPTVQPRVQPPVHRAEPAPEPVPVVDESPTTIFDDPGPARAPQVTPPVEPPVEPEEPRPPREPWVRGRPAAILTGLLVGAVIVAATAGALRLCTRIKGTSSCGGPGFFLLVAILILAVLLGAAMLRAAAVPQPGSTSFLAVGLLSVVTLLVLVDSIFEWWMIIVIPVVSVATFLLSHWITTTYTGHEDDASDSARQPEVHDLR